MAQGEDMPSDSQQRAAEWALDGEGFWEHLPGCKVFVITSSECDCGFREWRKRGGR